MSDKENEICKNVFKNDNIDERKKALIQILTDIINTKIKTGKTL